MRAGSCSAWGLFALRRTGWLQVSYIAGVNWSFVNGSLLWIKHTDRVVNGNLIRNVSPQLGALGNMLIKFLHVGKHES